MTTILSARLLALAGIAALAASSAFAGEDQLVQPVVEVAKNREPVIVHAAQWSAAREKLDAFVRKTGKRPNILVFIMDDVGWGDLGAFGGGIAVGAPTPNMDRLAREGLRLTSTYSQPSCSPTRATIMTGRLPMRHGLLRPPMAGEHGGLEGEITMAQLLSDAGYRTVAVGKWHMGENVQSQPQNVGFDDFYGFLTVADIYTEWRDPYFNPDIANKPGRQAFVSAIPFSKDLVKAHKGGAVEKVKEIDIPVMEQLDDLFAGYSIDFLKSRKGSKQPFFLYHATTGVHFDNYPSQQWKGKSPAGYPVKDVMVHLDDIAGRLIRTLQETGELENTLVFVTSDNGPEMETFPDSAVTPFRGSKGSTWEGGVRVPGIAYWPGMIKPARESDGIFDLADLFATSLTLAGAADKVPSDRYIDSIDQTSFLLADDGDSNRKYEYYWLGDKFSGVRFGEYKFMAVTEEEVHNDYLDGGFSGSATQLAYGALYNLWLDPKETHNILIRKLPYITLYQGAAARHLATFKAYPPKRIVEVQSR
ncbi:MAG TPA: arylsulfatase [Steroidobacteraceae bacterium]